MKRPRPHVLEEESRLALRELLPREWIIRDIHPDYGLDMEVTIVEGEEVTNKVFAVQIKATDRIDDITGIIPLRIESKYLAYYENYPLPVFILYYIKSRNVFYYLFAQKYVKENLSLKTPDWRTQKKVTIKLPTDSIFENAKNIPSTVIDSSFYVTLSRLNLRPGGAVYLLDGIPKSDDQELKTRTLRALTYVQEYEFTWAIDEFESILRLCTISPEEKIAILLNQGNAYYSISRFDNALTNYEAILTMTKKISGKNVLEGASAAFGNMGIIYFSKGDLNSALKYHQEALNINREIGDKQSEAICLSNIGLIYLIRGDSNSSLKYHQDALNIDRKIGYKQGEATDLGNIGLIYSDKGDPNSAFKYHQDALNIDRKIGYKQGEAIQLGNIGLICLIGGDLDTALKYLQDALNIYREIGDKQGEATCLGNIGNIYSAKGNLDNALKNLKKALKIDIKIGYKQGEANQLGNIGLILQTKGDPNSALKYLQDALNIHREIGYKQGEATQLGNIGVILKARGELDNALKYLQDALTILVNFNLIYGQDIFRKSINEIEQVIQSQ